MVPERIVIHLRKAASKRGETLKCFSVGIDGQPAQTLGDWKLTDYDAEKMSDLATEVFQCAQFDVDESGGRRKYLVIAYEGTGREAYQWAMMHVADPRVQAMQEHSSPTDGDVNEPTAQGLLAQTMRHLERTTQLMLQNSERVMRDMTQQLDSRDKRIAQLERREFDVMELARELHTRIGEMGAESERNADRIDKGISLLFDKFLPAAGVQLGILPEGFSTDSDPATLTQTIVDVAGAGIRAMAKANGSGNGSGSGSADRKVAPPPKKTDA
ncbi:MAG: hypothetical protein OEZ01_00575 [Candidatus Heimdallarchaeota archaeon]|nr:hypothetical protein [Candidatus Heimdallarchaeota archaeon]MDH5676611.1 hypothetical protein [Myxococcales bacterium]